MTEQYTNSGATISKCGKYRFMLWREWRGTGTDENWLFWEDDDGSPLLDGAGEQMGEPLACVFIMLNPSTADGEKDDPTIRKCVKLAKSWGFDQLIVINLFAWRATDPKALLQVPECDDPVGWQNQGYFEEALEGAGKIVCAWGANGAHLNQAETALGWIDEYNIRNAPVEALRVSEKTGQPWHPLYIPDLTTPIKFGGSLR